MHLVCSKKVPGDADAGEEETKLRTIGQVSATLSHLAMHSHHGRRVNHKRASGL